MTKKVGKIFIGIIIGLIAVGVVWYLIEGLRGAPDTEKQVSLIKDDLLSNQAIDTAKSKASVISFPITVSEEDMGVSDPF
jgi:hypothetical protein